MLADCITIMSDGQRNRSSPGFVEAQAMGFREGQGIFSSIDTRQFVCATVLSRKGIRVGANTGVPRWSSPVADIAAGFHRPR